ncbi:voltage-dependent calcium channel beta subunit-associated regulatory protein [Ambystoma mexicanum]|uniref:voltage-dependent calcium channel beta subunit-associated regulatory protein n=1 Tax=Ambystoma mexicanum TaxID=8296 RepID=UPI0037E8B91A
MNNESGVWENITDPATAAPTEEAKQDGYVLLLVLLSIFVGGTLVILSGLLIICRRCCETDRRYSRASDDPEKTNTTYLEETGPPQEITIRVDEVECLSASSFHDAESERFLSTCSTGRRVSFNEAALFDQGKKAQEKGRRYTLTEGDFHHLKNARLTHLHIPSPTLKIVTIHEGDTGDTNSITMTPRRPPTPNANLFLFQPPVSSLPQTALTSHSMSPSSALPGDTFNSTVDTSFLEVSPGTSTHSEDGMSLKALGRKGGSGTVSDTTPSPNKGAVLQFFTRLRRHASLEGASPYFKIKKWKFESSQRASSLDMRGSPKRHQFQRQRAASESMEQEDRDPHQTDIIQFIARTEHVAFHPLDAPFLPHPNSTPPSLGRLEGAEVAGSTDGAERGGEGTAEPQTTYRDIWSLRASLELNASSDQSSSNNDRDSVRSDAESISSLSGVPSFASQDPAEEGECQTEKTLPSQRSSKQESLESERGSDGELSTRKLLQMDSGYASIEAPSRLLEDSRILGAKERTASEKRLFFTNAGRKGTVFSSIDSKVLNEELEDEGAAGGISDTPMGLSPYGQMLPPRDSFQRRDYSIDEKTDALFNEFLRHDPQFDDSPLRSKHRSRVHLRKQWQRTKQYSDPGVRYTLALERQRTPLRRGDSVNYPLDTRYHSTLPRIVSTADEDSGEGGSGTEILQPVTARKTEPQPLGQGLEPEDVIQVIEEEPGEPTNVPDSVEATDMGITKQGQGPFGSPPGFDEHLAYGPQTTGAELMDKLSTSIEDRLYCNLRKSCETTECLVTVAHISPDNSPV